MAGRSSDEPLRLGLVGFGRWGRNLYRTVARSSDARIVAVASRAAETAAAVAPETVVVDSHAAILDRDDIDGLVLAVPPARQPDIAIHALSRAVPVMLQKPLALSSADADRIAAAAEQYGSPAFVDHTYLFHPAFEALRDLAAARGGPTAIRSVGGNDGPVRSDTPVLWDWAPHDIAMCLTLAAGSPTVGRCATVETRSTGDGPAETIEIDLVFPACRAGLCIGNAMPARVRRLEVDAGGDALIFDDVSRDSLTVNGTAVEVAKGLPLDRSFAAFVDLLRSGAASHASLDLGSRVVAVIDRCANQRDASQ